MSVKVLPLHVGCGEGEEDRWSSRREEAGLRLQATALVPPERASACQIRALTHNLREEGVVREQGLRELIASEVLQTRRLREVKTGRTVRPWTHEEVEDEKPPAGVLAEPSVMKAHEMPSVIAQNPRSTFRDREALKSARPVGYRVWKTMAKILSLADASSIGVC
jgi:hypothetical protein